MIDNPVPDTIEIHRRPPGGRRFRFVLLGLLVALFFGGGTALSWYVDRLWFLSLGYGDVFWTMATLEAGLFVLGTALTFAALFGAFRALRPKGFGEFGAGGVVWINDRPVRVPVGRALTLLAVGLSALIALITAAAWRPSGRRLRSGGTPAARTRLPRRAPSIRSSGAQSRSISSRFPPGRSPPAG